MTTLNRVSPTGMTSGVTISDYFGTPDSGDDNSMYMSSYAFLPAGWTIQNNIPVLVQPNLLNNVSLAPEDFASFNPQFLQSGDVFPGQPVNIQVTLKAAGAGTMYISGMCGNNPIVGGYLANGNPYSESVVFEGGGVSQTFTTKYKYTNIIYFGALTADVTECSVTTMPIILQNEQPTIPAALDLNSKAGSLLLPRQSTAEVVAEDSLIPNTAFSTSPLANSNTGQILDGSAILYSTVDGMQVYNKTTKCVSTKRNGRWDNLYIEDPLKTQFKYSNTWIKAATLKTLNTTPVNLLADYPGSYAGPLLVSSAPYGNGTVLLQNQPLVEPTQLAFTIASGAGTPSVIISGVFNGIYVSETVTVPINGDTLSSIYKYSYIHSITGSAAGSGNLSVGYNGITAGASFYINRMSFTLFGNTTAFAGDFSLVLQDSAEGSFVYDIPMTNNFITSANTSGYNVMVTSIGVGVRRVGNFIELGAAGAYTGGSAAAMLLVGMEYAWIY